MKKVEKNSKKINGKWLLLLLLIPVLYVGALMTRIGKRPNYAPLMGYFYAHRGFHDNNVEVPENSMTSFVKAIEAGYGIELDVQLTKDRIPVVFHDETLTRVCGVEGNVRDYTYEELNQLALCGTEEKIPLFQEALDLIDGKVPVIVEIKIHESAGEVCKYVDEILSQYDGIYCIQSFHPMAVKWYHDNRPEVIRGQLSSNFNKPEKREPISQFMVHYLLFNFLTQPDFISYEHTHKDNLSRLICKHLYRSPAAAWTIRSQEELDACVDDFDLFIFEGFEP